MRLGHLRLVNSRRRTRNALAIPIVLGILIVIYAAIGAMVIFAGALTSFIEAIFPIIPTLWQ